MKLMRDVRKNKKFLTKFKVLYNNRNLNRK